MSSPVATAPAALVLLRIALAVALASGAVIGPAQERFAEALAGLQAPTNAKTIEAEEAARRAALDLAEQLGGNVAVLAQRAAVEAAGRASDAAGRELSIRRMVATQAELQRIQREDPCTWVVLLAAERKPTKRAIVAMARVVSRPAA